MRVIGTKILVEQFTPDDSSKGGIVIPEQFRQETWWCRVISIGGRVKAGLVAVGMPVLIKAHHGMILEHDGRTYRSVEVEDIIGTLSHKPYCLFQRFKDGETQFKWLHDGSPASPIFTDIKMAEAFRSAHQNKEMFDTETIYGFDWESSGITPILHVRKSAGTENQPS